MAVAAGSSLHQQIRRRWRLFFGPYPLLMMATWANKIGLIKGNGEAVAFLDQLRRAAIEGELEFYGQSITATGVERELTKIPATHLRTCAISLGTSGVRGRNEETYTYDPNPTASWASRQVGHFCNLHVSRRVLGIIQKIWEDAHR